MVVSECNPTRTRLKLEDCFEAKASLDNSVRPCLGENSIKQEDDPG